MHLILSQSVPPLFLQASAHNTANTMANPSHSWRGALLAILGAALLCIVVVEATCKKDSYIHKPGDECPPDFTAVAG